MTPGTITLARHSFEGPYSVTGLLRHKPGVWAVLDDRNLPPVDAGQADDVQAVVEAHPRHACWRRHCHQLAYAAFYAPREEQRQAIERDLRQEYQLVCAED